MWLIKDGMKKVFQWPTDWEMLGQTRLTDFVSLTCFYSMLLTKAKRIHFTRPLKLFDSIIWYYLLP